MHWIIDRIVGGEPATQRLVAAIEAHGDTYDFVRKPPFADYIVGPEGDEPIDLRIDGPCFATGSTSMELVSRAQGWTPGYVDAPGVDEGVAHWGDHMLNPTMRIGRLDQIEAPTEPSFVRPVDDGKAFAGTIHDGESFDEFRRSALSVTTWTTLPPDTMIAIAPVRRISEEYRCLAVDGRFVTGCRYKSGSLVRYVPGVPDEVEAFVDERLAEWTPRRAIIVDVAVTDDGLKVVETNSVSSAGFYALDMNLYVAAIRTIS